MRVLRIGAVLLGCVAGAAPHPDLQRPWQTGKIVTAEQPERVALGLASAGEIWNPWFTHWYTIESGSVRIKAKEMVHAPKPFNHGRKPALNFQRGQQVRFVVERGRREVYILDDQSREHVLTLEAVVEHRRAR